MCKDHPRLIVEVLSDSTAACDRGERFAQDRLVDCYRRDPSDHSVLFPFSGSDTVEFASVGFKAPVAALFEDVEPFRATPDPS